MTVTPANLQRSTTAGDAQPFVPYATETPALADHDYVQEEWIASGEDQDGHLYETTVLVRRPRDVDRFSGTVVVEPLHVHGIAPIWIYCHAEILRSGHAWVEVTSQKTTLDQHVKPSNAARYGELHIEGPDTADFDSDPHFGDAELTDAFWADAERRNRASSEILAEVGATLRSADGPFEGWPVAHVILAGHSQTGSVVTYYVRDAHQQFRLADGSPVYDGFFPTGFPFAPFLDVGVPVMQVMSDGDVSSPDRAVFPYYEGRRYRRDDSDEPGDPYRLYELAGVPHMGTRVAPFDDVTLWQAQHAGIPDLVVGPKMNSLPHFELFNMALHHLVAWVAEGTTPPRAERIAVGADGSFVQDEHGNTVGGVRCAPMDVPRATYHATLLRTDGTPTFITIGSEEPLDPATLKQLYKSQLDYVERFEQRLAELIAEGWFLEADAEDLRAEARKAELF